MNATTSERFATQESVQVQVYGQGRFVSAVLKNLSLTGAGLELLEGPQALQKGDLVSLTIELKSLAKTHSIDAEVVWTGRGVVGVVFMKAGEVFTKMLSKAAF